MDLFLLMLAMVFMCASIYIGLDSISYNLKKISERIDKMDKESASTKPICENCKWRDDFTGVCCNDKSPYVTDYKDDDECCPVYEEV